MTQPPKKLLEQVQDAIRLKHYSYQTEKAYIYWIRRYILFHNKRHPQEMGGAEMDVFAAYKASLGLIWA
jgi:Phage integrase, N-terminal SAM-like domain